MAIKKDAAIYGAPQIEGELSSTKMGLIVDVANQAVM
jgi:hypothetical protein